MSSLYDRVPHPSRLSSGSSSSSSSYRPGGLVASKMDIDARPRDSVSTDDDDDSRSLLSLLGADGISGKGNGPLAFPMPPSTLPMPSSSSPHPLAPFPSSSDYSDGAASSDTDASLVNSHSSDADAGPFTPLTPITPGTASTSRPRRSRSSSGGAALGRGPSSWSAAATPSGASLPGSVPMGSSASNPWRPRKLQLVHRQERDATPTSSLADWISAEHARPPMPGPSSNSMGLGIQLPKSPAAGSDFMAMAHGSSERSATPTEKSSRGGRKKLGGKGQGLKTLALAGRSSGATSPLLSSDTRPPTPSPQLLGSPWQRDGFSEPPTRSPMLASRPASPAFPSWAPRSRQASSDSNATDALRSGNKSPLPVLPRTPTFATSSTGSQMTLSWAREQEERAQRGTEIPPPTQSQEDVPTPESPSQKRDMATSPSLWSQVNSAGPSTGPALPGVSRHRSDSMSSRRSSSPSKRRKKPPTPLILLPNGRQASLASSAGLLSASGSEISPAPSPALPPPPPPPAPSKSTLSTNQQSHGRLDAPPLTPASSLLSPAGVDFSESFRTPTFSPPSAPSATLAAEEEDKGATDGASKSLQLSVETLVPAGSKRASTPLKTAYFDPEDQDESSPSDYGDDDGEGQQAAPPREASNDGLESMDQTSEENIPLIFRRMMKTFRSSTSQDKGTEGNAAAQNDGQTMPPRWQSETMSTLPSLSSLLDSSSSSSSQLGSKEHNDTTNTGLSSADDVDVAEAQRERKGGDFRVIDGQDEGEMSQRDLGKETDRGLGIGLDDKAERDAAERASDAAVAPESSPVLAPRSAADHSNGAHTLTHDAFEYDFGDDSERVLPTRPSLLGDVSEPSLYSMPSAVQDETLVAQSLSGDERDGKEAQEAVRQPARSSSPPVEQQQRQPLSAFSDSEEMARRPVASPEHLPEALPPSTPSYQSPFAGGPPQFNTGIFKGPPTPRREGFDDDMIAPNDRAPPSSRSTDSLQPSSPAQEDGVDYYRQQSESDARRRPTSKLHMQPLHLLSSSPAPKSPDAGPSASRDERRPKLWLDTLAPPVMLRPPQAQKMLPVPTSSTSSKASFSSTSTVSSASSASHPYSNRFAGPQPPMPLQSDREKLYAMVPQSAPLPQGAFSPIIPATPNGAQRSVFEDWDDDAASTKLQNGGLSSRWSSGSESEGDAPKRSSSKSRKGSTKKRSSSAAPSARNSVSSQAGGVMASNGSAIPTQLPRGKSFLHTLGLRKKSMPSLRDSAVTARSNSPATPALESPALPRVSTADGFPFPGMVPGQPSKTTSSAAFSRPASKEWRTSSSAPTHKKQSASVFSQLSAPLNHKRSTTSLRAEATGAAGSSRRGSSSQRVTIGLNERTERGEGGQGTGESAPTSTAAAAQDARSPPPSPKKEKRASAAATGRSSEAFLSRKKSGAIDAAPRLPRLSHTSSKRYSKSSTDLHSDLRKSLLTGPDMARSQTAGEAQPPSSNEATPRVAYIGLADEPAPAPASARHATSQRAPDEKEGQALSAIGQGLVDSLLSPDAEESDPLASRIESTFEAKSASKQRMPRRRAKGRKAARLAREQETTPHYPSWTDHGRQWLRDQHVDAAEGLVLVAASRSRGFSAPQKGFRGGRGGAEGDDDSSDDYGGGDESPDKGAARRSTGGGGASGGPGDDSESDHRYDDAEESDDASTSEESEDDYGEDQDSDDQPLGQSVSDVNSLQRRLKKQEQRQQRTRANRSKSDPSQPQRRGKQSQGSLDGGELANRLAGLSMRRQQSATPAAQSQDDARVERINRARSLANRVRPNGGSDGPARAAPAAPAPAAPAAPAPSSLAPRPRRSSDAAQRGGQPGITLPPLDTMPTNAMRAAAMRSTLSAGAVSNNAAVNQAAIAMATQAARDGRIPVSAVPAQAKAFAAQVMAARSQSASGSQDVARAVHRKAPPSSRGSIDATTSDRHVSSERRRPSISSISSDAPRRARPTGLDARVAPPISSSDGPSSDLYEDALSQSQFSQRSRQSQDETPVAVRQRRESERASAIRLQQHRIYIVSRQRYSQCQVPLHARARDVVLDILERETVQALPGRGGWALFDVSPTLRTERPLREYEVVSSIAEARPDAVNDYFILKQTELSIYASIRAVPNASPALAGQVYVRDKRGKWSKRWLELRDHAIYHAKSEKGKDEAFLCHLSAFDVYLCTEGFKAPKAHSFALRSQDSIDLFEDKDDYVHYLSLSDPSAHRDWVRAITNARTYVLRQEHAALFTTFGAGPGAQQPQQQQQQQGSASLSRRGTSKSSSSRPAQSDPPQPQQQQPALASRDAVARGPFEQGSLLAAQVDERTRAKMEEERRRVELAHRQRKALQDGQPLISVTAPEMRLRADR